MILSGCCCCVTDSTVDFGGVAVDDDADMNEETDGVLGLTGISGAGVFGNGGGMLDNEPLSSSNLAGISSSLADCMTKFLVVW